MATSFIEIYTRAMTEFKSPMLARLQETDTIAYLTTMSEYLNTAITFYNPNVNVYKRLTKSKSEEFCKQTFLVEDVAQDVFEIRGASLPTEDSIIQVEVNGDKVQGYTIDYLTSTITLDEAITQSVVDIYWYNDGSFENLTSEDITLLSLAVCWVWAIQTQNNQLDIDRSLNDSDFKQSSVAQALSAKVEWAKHYEQMFKRELSKSDWRSLFRRGKV